MKFNPKISEKDKQIKQNDTEPLVSICIPTYNNEKYIAKTIESVLIQNYTNLEIIICDDNSSDRTINIVNSIRDDRLKVLRNERNLGMVKNCNICIRAATGKYVKILCGDDLLCPGSIKKAVTAMELNENVDVVTGSSKIINSNGKVVMNRRLYAKDKLIEGKKFAKYTLVRARNYFAEPSVMMFRTDMAISKNIFSDPDLMFCIDWDAGLTMAYEGDVYYIGEPIALFRISQESTSVKMNKAKDTRMYNMSIDLFKKHQKLNVIKLNKINLVTFKLLTKFYIVARAFVQKYKGGV